MNREGAQVGKVIVFTDLDGTLLDADSYDFKGAEEALALLGKSGIPLVLASSKTRLEIEDCRERLGNTHPFISENGGGVFTPRGYFPEADASAKICDDNNYEQVSFGVPYEDLRRALTEIREELSLDIRGFGDMTPQEVSRLTGLDLEAAKRAKERDYDEPFLCDADDVALERILKAIEARGLAWTRGEFLHILGADSDKARGLKYLRGRYEEAFGSVITIALGDGLNDMAMLREADIGILLAKPNGSYEETGTVEGLIKAPGSGPKTWNEAVLSALKRVVK